MDIGTAKPSRAVRARHPHHLIDIRDPAESYSAGEFVRDARAAIAAAHAAGRLPLLVGGTMLYLRALLHGIAPLAAGIPRGPRARWKRARPARAGRCCMRSLRDVDPHTAARVHVRDPQRIQRALEVYQLTGRPISEWQRATRGAQQDYRWLRIALIPADRRAHRAHLATRFAAMVGSGLLEEVRAAACARGSGSSASFHPFNWLPPNVGVPRRSCGAGSGLCARPLRPLASWPSAS